MTKGITGYIYHTVPVAVYAWLRHYGDFRATVEAVLECGGDTDTVGAIAGAWLGPPWARQAFPKHGYAGSSTGPGRCDAATVADRLGDQLRTGKPLGEISYCWPAVAPRNLFFVWWSSLTAFAVWRRPGDPTSRPAPRLANNGRNLPLPIDILYLRHYH